MRPRDDEPADEAQPSSAERAESRPTFAGAGDTVPSIPSPPPAEELERAVALARLKGRLFAREAPVMLGRYHLLEMVGKGGMGVVWGAWDPQLERRVAIKVMRPTVPEARARMLVEGQALAKLSHPNVVPIFDVGILDDRVYLVMEWVRGKSLRELAQQGLTMADTVAVYRQAGEGLLAAHRAGLVHRDFKPDNAMRGDDGRVRVLDFGLARGEVSAVAETADADQSSASGLTVGAGTPSYMAPEQVRGDALTAVADQYAFCVSLREALAARRPKSGRASPGVIPRALAQAIERGTAVDPARRFSSMRELLDVLDADPRRRLRRGALGAAAAAAAVVAFVVGRSGADAPPDPCSGGALELAGAWADDRRAAVRASLGALSDYGREQAAAVVRDLDEAAQRWTVAHRSACEAHLRAELPVLLYQRRLGCLARVRVALATASEVLRAATSETLDPALLAARSLPDAALCVHEDASQVAPPPAALAHKLAPVAADIERARILALAADPGAGALARSAAQAAIGLGYAPLTARAQLVLGQIEAGDSRWDAAEDALGRAFEGALRVDDDVMTVEAFARRLWVGSRRGRAVDGATVIEPLATRTGPAGWFGRALLYNNLATRQLAAADRAGARRYLEAARAELAARGDPFDVELVSVAQNLVLVADDAGERERRASAVVALTEHALGRHHAKTLAVRVFEANETANLALARTRFAQICDDYQRLRPHLVAALANCAYRLAWLHDESGDRVAATAAMKLAGNAPDPERLWADVADGYVAAFASAAPPSPAIDALDALVTRHGAASEFWRRIAAVDAAIAAALASAARGDVSGSRTRWARALRLAESVDAPLVQRRMARCRVALARSFAGEDLARAAGYARAALPWVELSGAAALADELRRLAGAATP